MKALAISEPGKTAYVDLPQPKAGADEVLIDVLRVGFCGSDLNTFRGLNPVVTFPRIPGHEIAGLVAAVGVDVPAEIRAGLLVTALPYTACGQCPSCRNGRTNACRSNQTLGVQRDGAMTAKIALPWQKLLWSPRLSVAEHAMVEPLSVGLHAVRRGRVTARDTVMVFGCGMVGLGVISGAAWACGARVIAVDIDDAKLALARRCGAAHTINPSRENLHAGVLELTQGDGPDVVIEAVGSPQTFRAAVDEVAFAGRVVYIGYAKEPVAYETRQFVLKELDILGSRNATREDFQAVMGILESGRFPLADTITKVVPLSEAAAALADWARDPSRVTKIHVEIASGS